MSELAKTLRVHLHRCSVLATLSEPIKYEPFFSILITVVVQNRPFPLLPLCPAPSALISLAGGFCTFRRKFAVKNQVKKYGLIGCAWEHPSECRDFAGI